MDTIQSSITINAGKEKVWHTMLDKETYPLWTKEFGAGSSYEGSWEKGSEIRFVAPGEDDQLQGMVSRIKENIPYSFISIEHVGMINNGVVDTSSEKVKQWAPSYENYSFTETDGRTTVNMEMQIDASYKDMFEQLWAKALIALKDLCEGK